MSKWRGFPPFTEGAAQFGGRTSPPQLLSMSKWRGFPRSPKVRLSLGEKCLPPKLSLESKIQNPKSKIALAFKIEKNLNYDLTIVAGTDI
ncbi:MAG: hypothetical protein AAF349_01290 [Cyanobacteria bacterium P01_A01_bin.68]